MPAPSWQNRTMKCGAIRQHAPLQKLTRVQRKTVAPILAGVISWIVVALMMLTLAGCGGAVVEPREPTEYWDPGFQPTKRWVAMEEGVQAEGSTPSSPGMAAEDELLDNVRYRAEQGHAFYQATLGIMYLEGDGVPKNDAEAVKWFRMAAEQGDAGSHLGVVTAQFYLGLVYVNGWGVPQDFLEAVKWYHMAAERGHAISQYSLGLLYRGGAFGIVPQDLVQAYAWFNIVAAQGDEDAARERKDLGGTMTEEQLARAQELSREYWEAYVLPFRN